MTTKDPELGRGAVATMVVGFARTLSARGLTARTARLETRLSWPGSPDALFALETAMTAAWPHDCATRPMHELIWVTETTASRGWVKIRAFDAEGRLLLDRRYGAELDPSDDQHAQARARG
jgi:hypothetical protein